MRMFCMCMSIGAIVTLQACTTVSTKPSQDSGKQALVTASCPELTKLTDDSFAATTTKLVEVAGIYHECRQAALGKAPEKEAK